MDIRTATQLFPIVAPYVGVRWEDEQTTAELLQMIMSAAAYLDRKRGAEADYTVPGLSQDLLMDRVRYHRDGALDVFEANFRSQILAMQNERKVSEYAEAQAAVSPQGLV